MINSKFKFLMTALVLVLSMVFMFKAQASAFDLFKDTCTNAKDSAVCQANNTGRQDTKNNNAALRTINVAANIIAAVAGVAAVIMIIIAGFSMITAGGSPVGNRSGDPNKVKSAQSRIINASIGLIIIALAWTITRFIIDKLIQ